MANFAALNNYQRNYCYFPATRKHGIRGNNAALFRVLTNNRRYVSNESWRHFYNGHLNLMIENSLWGSH